MIADETEGRAVRFYRRTGPNTGISYGPIGGLIGGMLVLLLVLGVIVVVAKHFLFIAVIGVATYGGLYLIAVLLGGKVPGINKPGSVEYRCAKNDHRLDRSYGTCPIDGSPVQRVMKGSAARRG